MKRAMPWDDEEDDSSSNESSDSGSNGETEKNICKKNIISSKSSKEKASEAYTGGDSGKRGNKVLNFEALSRYGYKGGLSVLSVPPPKEEDKQDWSWSDGKKTRGVENEAETYEEREKTRATLLQAEQLANVETPSERRNRSFAQKEKRKRDLGQASRGKSYVEEEKRLLRENGVYSGFDA